MKLASPDARHLKSAQAISPTATLKPSAGFRLFQFAVFALLPVLTGGRLDAQDQADPRLGALVLTVNDNEELSLALGDREIAPPQKPLLRQVDLLNRDHRPVELGAPLPFMVEVTEEHVLYWTDYDSLPLEFSVEYIPDGKDALEIVVTLTSDSLYIDHLDLQFLALRMTPPPAQVQMVYPAGRDGYTPAMVFQDQAFSAGITLSEIHGDNPESFTSISGQSRQDRLPLCLSTNWLKTKMFAGKKQREYIRHLRLTFGPAQDGSCALETRSELWRSYREELNAACPPLPLPQFDPARPILKGGFASRPECITLENPLGWDSVRREAGPAAKPPPDTRDGNGPGPWLLALADEHIRQMRQINAQAVIFWTLGSNPPGSKLKPLAEAPWFHPEFERRLPVEAAQNWDVLTVDLVLEDATGKICAMRDSQPLHVSNRLQRFGFRDEDLKPEGRNLLPPPPELPPAAALAQEPLALSVGIANSRTTLLGLKAGASFTLPALVTLADEAVTADSLVKTDLKLKGIIRKIERTAINAFVQRFHDAGFETGFVTRGEFICGVPWMPAEVAFDWRSEWQYQMFAGRFREIGERFGPKCRWFYLDAFGQREPAEIYRRLRLDFPTLIFAAEQGYDLTHRLLGTSLADQAPTALERLVNPAYIALVQTAAMKPPGGISHEEWVARTVIGNPAVIPLVQPSMIEDYLKAKARAAQGLPELKPPSPPAKVEKAE